MAPQEGKPLFTTQSKMALSPDLLTAYLLVHARKTKTTFPPKKPQTHTGIALTHATICWIRCCLSSWNQHKHGLMFPSWFKGNVIPYIARRSYSAQIVKSPPHLPIKACYSQDGFPPLVKCLIYYMPKFCVLWLSPFGRYSPWQVGITDRKSVV